MFYLYIYPAVCVASSLSYRSDLISHIGGRKTDLGVLCSWDLVASARRAGPDLSDLMFTSTGDGAWTTSATEPDMSFLTTFLGDTSLTGKDSLADKDLSPFLESTGLQGLFNGEDLASFFAMETMIP